MNVHKPLLWFFLLIFCFAGSMTIHVAAQSTAAVKKKNNTPPAKTRKHTVAKKTPTAKKTPQEEIKPVQLLRIGSGAIGGNYFVLGELVGGVVSHPLGSLACDKGGTCGIENLQTQNITSAGSLDNLNKLQKGTIQTGFVQSDLAYWAYTGTGLFENKEKHSNLRAIASLYPESMHILVRKNAGINSVADMIGKRISVGARKSGTLYSARLVLDAYKISEDDMETAYLNSSQSMQKLLADELDGLFFTVGAPAPAMEKLFKESQDFTLLSIGKEERQEIFKQGHYFSPYTIAAGTYKHIPAVETISVYALWLTTDKTDKKLVYQLVKSLWGDAAKHLFNSSYIGQTINIDDSLKGIGIPLHDGAKKYYNEIGKRF